MEVTFFALPLLLKFLKNKKSYHDSTFPQIRNLIECSGTMPEKLQGSFSYTRFCTKETCADTKPPYPIKRLEAIR